VPVETRVHLAGDPWKAADITFTPLRLDAPNTPPCLQWSADASSVYALEVRGLVRKISVPGLIEERRVLLGRNCLDMARSKEGLVVAVADRSELWVLDETTLELRKKIPVPGALKVVSAPSLPLAFTTADQNGLTAVDLADGRVLRRWEYHEVVRGLRHVEHFALTPDGRYLFLVGASMLARCKVNAGELVLEEKISGIGSSNERLELSPDGLYVGGLCWNGNEGRGRYKGNNMTLIYRTSDLGEPALGVTLGWGRTALGFDKARGTLYGANWGFHLIVCTPKNVKTKECTFDPYHSRLEFTRQFLVHPQGGRLFVLTDHQLVWAGLP
jgi:hypothetical protein